jgi:uncharacterized protein (TIGR02145 family)
VTNQYLPEMKKIYLSLFIYLFTLASFSQSTDKRIALIIGNSTYPNVPLKNPVNDANLMATTLQRVGFTVIKKVDVNRAQMAQAIADFWSKLGNYDVALFFYAGHGVQVNGVNYLIPVDATLESQDMVSFEAISVNDVVSKFEEYPKNTNIVILDACRNNPFRSWARGGNRGFVAMSPGSGTFIAFATSEGSTASDGTGANGLFTEKLVKNIKKPGPIETVFKNTRVDVQNASSGSQSPQEWTKLTGDFYFVKEAGQEQDIAEENPVVEEEHPKNNPTNDLMITEELMTSTIKITSDMDDDFYFDGQLKGKFTKGRSYTLNNIAVGKHELKVGNWTKMVSVENGKTLEIATLMGLTDSRDGKVYKTVRIDNQIWMAQNLNYNTSESWCYDNNSANGNQFGRLYTYEDSKNICPQGWHLPSKVEFETLINSCGGSPESAYRALLPGGNSGFSALFGGMRGTNGKFRYFEKDANFWSSSLDASGNAWQLVINSNNSEAKMFGYFRSCGFSVRCLQDN